MWDLIVSVPDHCLSFYLTVCSISVVRFGKNTEKFTKPHTTNAPNRTPCFVSTKFSFTTEESRLLHNGRVNKAYTFVIS